MSGVNSVLDEGSPAALLESITNEHMGVANVQEAQALHYLNLLKAMKAAKTEVSYVIMKFPDLHIYM